MLFIYWYNLCCSNRKKVWVWVPKKEYR